MDYRFAAETLFFYRYNLRSNIGEIPVYYRDNKGSH